MFFILLSSDIRGQKFPLESYDITWNSASRNSSESMPVGGGDIGLNVWVENGDVLFYLGKSGAFDENNTLLKLGRVRLQLSPNPFAGQSFSQRLELQKGQLVIRGEDKGVKASLLLWVDVHSPNIHVQVKSNKKIAMEATYESWRYKDRFPKKKENNANSWKWAPPQTVRTPKDSIHVEGESVVFFHRNTDSTAFDIVTQQQGLAVVKDSLFNPLENLVSGGIMGGRDLEFKATGRGQYMDTDYAWWTLKSKAPSRSQQLQLTLHAAQSETTAEWFSALEQRRTDRTSTNKAKRETEVWWEEFWNRSHIALFPKDSVQNLQAWKIGRNYQLFRYMLACNAYGEYPTKFNGGLFTYDPSSVDSSFRFTPDFRNWGGGTHTAQNQRLVYWPMLKSGDFDMMSAQFKFYQRLQGNAEMRSKIYWSHGGASFTEQLENFGLPNPAEYGWKRPPGHDPGLQHNAWLEHQWDTVLEFCMMMLEVGNYQGSNIQQYIPFVESCIHFFDEHYHYLARKLGSKALDQNGHLIFYPGSSAETYKMAYNASSTIAALSEVTKRVIHELPNQKDSTRRRYLESFLEKIPPLPTREIEGVKMLAPAQQWARINNTESPQLYPVFPWGIYGVGHPGLDLARNTYFHDPEVLKFRSHVGWKQDNIFAARLGLTAEAKRLILLKLKDAPRRFPTFWGPGYDWVPDHNWGGSGMIGLQEMLMQSVGQKIYLFPAWPKEWDVHFKLHAPQQTTIEGRLENGELVELNVHPAARRNDVINMLGNSGLNP
ncbi:MAG: DUF5703 domain-containing protein [Sphingobacterium sp.]